MPSTLKEFVASGQKSFSFEFFPPKDADSEVNLMDTIRRLEPFAPLFVSVTYGAGGSTQDRTTAITARIAEETTLSPMAHLTCVGASRAELRSVIAGYAASGVSTIMALRGDPPGGPGQPWTAHPDGLDHAIDLVRLVKELGSFAVGVAAFPDQHPESSSLDQDAQVLAAKADAGADFAITQFFFDADSYFRLVERTRAQGCDIPIIPGIMPVTNIKQVTRFAELAGAPLPRSVTDRLDAVAHDPVAVRQVGVELATQMCQRLLEGGAPGLHFYTLNKSSATRDIFASLGLQVGA